MANTKKISNRTPVTLVLKIDAPNRTRHDIGQWRTALRRFEEDQGRHQMLFNLYEDLLIDGVLADAYDKRRDAILNSELIFQNAKGELDQSVMDIIDTSDFETLLTAIYDRKQWGRSGIEFDLRNGFKVWRIPGKHIDLKHKEILKREYHTRGIPYEGDDFIMVFGDPTDKGIFLRTAPMVIYKRGGFGDYAQWLELFGIPQRIGKYNALNPESRKLLEAALRDAGAAPYAVVPDDTNVETPTSGQHTGSPFNDFRKACNEEILITELGQTLTTVQGDKGARSLGEVHKNVEDGKHKSDLRYVQRILNQRVLPFLQARGLAPQGKFVFPKAAKEITVDELIKLTDIIDIPAAHVHERFSLPMVKDGDVIARKRTSATQKEPSPPKEDKDKKEPPKQPKARTVGNADESSFFKRLYDFFVDAPQVGATLNFLPKWTNSTTKVKLSDDYNINFSKLFKEALKEIYNGDESVVNKHLFEISNNALQDGLSLAFDGLEWTGDDAEFIEQFRKNTAVFSAFKNHQQTKDIVALLTDDDGNLRSFFKFKKAALKVSQKYNVDWLQTEYNTAVQAARSAVNFRKFQATAHLYPNLEYMLSTSVHKRDSHLAYVGTILPIDHPWWNEHLPPSDWNCHCWVKQTDKRVTDVPSDELINPVMAINPAKTASFCKLNKHPYCANTDKGMMAMIEEVAGSLYKKYQWQHINKWRQQIDPYKGRITKSKNFATGQMTVLRKSVKEIFAHNTNPVVRKYVMWMENDAANWKYLGWANAAGGKHNEAKSFLYYQVKVAGETKYVNMELHKVHGEVPYAIYDTINKSSILSGKPPA